MSKLARLLLVLVVVSAPLAAQQPVTLVGTPTVDFVGALYGTAGSGSTRVLTVQGNASGTPIPISAASLPLPSTAATSTKQSDGTQKTQIVDGSGNVIASTSNNLNVQCSNCTGSGVSATDAASFTATTSLFAPGGGFFQTTATNNALTTGQQGTFQVTANRALFTNLRNASGTEIGTSTTPVQVTLANTGANATAVKVDGSAVTQPVAGAKTNNNAAPGATNVGALGFLANAAKPTWTEGNLVLGSVDLNGAIRATFLDSGGTTMTDTTAHAVKTLSVDSTGAAIVPTTLATDDGALGTKTNITGGVMMGYAKAAAPTDVTADGDAASLWMLRNGSPVVNIAAGGALIGATSNALDVNIKSGAGSGGTAVADEAAFTQGTTQITPMGGLFKTSYTALTSGQAGVAQLTSNGGLYTNLDKVQGTNVDVNSGNKSAGTIRVVLATDQPALTNKLLVTPDSVALPANQSVNVSQINGVTTTMGNGVSGTGVQRVTIASDSTGTIVATSATAANLNARTDTSGATGAAPPARADFVGGLGSGATGGLVVGIPVADTFKAVSITSATTTLLVTGVSGRHVRIGSIHLITAIANNVAIISGTGATCGTGTTGMAGGTTAANGYNLAANGGLALGSGFGTVMQTTATGDSVCAITSAAGPLSGTIAYAIY